MQCALCFFPIKQCPVILDQIRLLECSSEKIYLSTPTHACACDFNCYEPALYVLNVTRKFLLLHNGL